MLRRVLEYFYISIVSSAHIVNDNDVKNRDDIDYDVLHVRFFSLDIVLLDNAI